MVIQRNWKILSESGSADSGGSVGSSSSGGGGGSTTPASSTEANRSPIGLNTSSDDSNCSNQTASNSLVPSITNSPLCSNSVYNKFELQNAGNTLNVDNMRYVTTPQMAESALQKLRQRYNINSNNGGNTTSIMESAMRALELVRISIQDTFDKEVHQLLKKYTETYFQLALKNIKENLGENAVSDDMLSKMSCSLLENAKHQYSQFRSQKIVTVSSGSQNPTSLMSLNSQNSLIRLSGLKRTLTDRTSENAANHGTGIFAIEMTKRIHLDRSTSTLSELKAQTLNALNSNGSGKAGQQLSTGLTITTASTTNSIGARRNAPTGVGGGGGAGPLSTNSGSASTSGSIGRRQIFWNTANISTTTKFVLDVQVNVAFGFGGDSKDRVASKHPELIRYLPDNDDRDWLVSQQIIAPQNRNSRFLFLIYDEVCRLTQNYEVYRQRAKVDLSLIMTFTVADFIVEKMKIFFIDLNIKSRGLITNSHTIDGRNQANVGGHQQGNDSSSSNGSSSGSHLRNALLQGTASPPVVSKIKISTRPPMITASASGTATVKQAPTAATSIPNIVLRLPSVELDATAAVSDASLAGANTMMLAPAKPKSTSVLSSSHATLTALLNNSKVSLTSKHTAAGNTGSTITTTSSVAIAGSTSITVASSASSTGVASSATITAHSQKSK